MFLSNGNAQYISAYDEIINSIPVSERGEVLYELETASVCDRAKSLYIELSQSQIDKVLNVADLNLSESRILFLAALKSLKEGSISVGQFASIHILDAAVRSLYINPMLYLTYFFVDDAKNPVFLKKTFPIDASEGMPQDIFKFRYMPIITSGQSFPVQESLIQRFFNFSDSEWIFFCSAMHEVPDSEKFYYVLRYPELGNLSSIMPRAQSLLSCMQILDWPVETAYGVIISKVMLVPSFSMFQLALNAKARTLNRSSLELVPTYGYIAPERYAELKSMQKIATVLYLPEKDFSLQYKNYIGRYRVDVDGHPFETAFGGFLHDIYHAFRELVIAENIARARMRLARISSSHPHNKFYANKIGVDTILIDGELIFSTPSDTIFNSNLRPSVAQKFGDIFYVSSLCGALSKKLKFTFIEDMVVNQALWQKEYGIGKSDLVEGDQGVYELMRFVSDAAYLSGSNLVDYISDNWYAIQEDLITTKTLSQSSYKYASLVSSISFYIGSIGVPLSICSVFYAKDNRLFVSSAIATVLFYTSYFTSNVIATGFKSESQKFSSLIQAHSFFGNYNSNEKITSTNNSLELNL